MSLNGAIFQVTTAAWQKFKLLLYLWETRNANVWLSVISKQFVVNKLLILILSVYL